MEHICCLFYSVHTLKGQGNLSKMIKSTKTTSQILQTEHQLLAKQMVVS